MARTEIDGDQILDHSIQKKDLDILTSGQAVITDVQVVGAGLSITYTGADAGTGKVTISLNSGGFGTSFYPFEKVGEEVTTDNGFIQYAEFTTPLLTTGIYIIHFAANVTNSSKKTIGLQFNWRLNGVTTYAPIHESYNAPTTADIYETRSAFKVVIVTAEGTVSVQTSYGFTTAGGTAKINLSDVYLFKAAELP
jgi:hypothetical protein